MDAKQRSLSESDDLAKLTARFAHRVRYFANRIERRFGFAPIWHDDLESAGYWGLLAALRNRRPEAHDCELSAYVSRRIEGAVFDEARKILGRVVVEGELDPERDRAWEDDDPASFSSSAWPDPEDAADAGLRWTAIEAGLSALDAGHRDLLLAYASGASIAELARDEGASSSRLQSRMTRAARQVRGRSPELRRILRCEV